MDALIIAIGICALALLVYYAYVLMKGDKQ